MNKEYENLISKFYDLTTEEKKKEIFEEFLRINEIFNRVSKLEKEPINLNNLISSILTRYEIFSEYNFIFNSKKEYIINADRKKIEQVFYNLINNAMNYTGKDKKVYR